VVSRQRRCCAGVLAAHARAPDLRPPSFAARWPSPYLTTPSTLTTRLTTDCALFRAISETLRLSCPFRAPTFKQGLIGSRPGGAPHASQHFAAASHHPSCSSPSLSPMDGSGLPKEAAFDTLSVSVQRCGCSAIPRPLSHRCVQLPVALLRVLTRPIPSPPLNASRIGRWVGWKM
jgi:hypothetical protein